jgi:hypothetical protein
MGGTCSTGTDDEVTDEINDLLQQLQRSQAEVRFARSRKRTVLRPREAAILADLCSANAQTSVLDLSGLSFAKEVDMGRIGVALSASKIQSLSLQDCCLDEQSLIRLVDSLRESTTLCGLELCDCDIGDEGLVKISELCSKLALGTLVVGVSRNLGTPGRRAVQQLLRTPSLQVLALSGRSCGLQSSTLAAVFEESKESSIRTLRIHGFVDLLQSRESCAVAGLLRALGKWLHRVPLAELSLQFPFGHHGLEVFAAALPEKCTLQALSLRCCGLGTQLGHSIETLVKHCVELTSLDLALQGEVPIGCELNDRALMRVLVALQRTKIRSLNLSGLPFDNSVATSLCEMLEAGFFQNLCDLTLDSSLQPSLQIRLNQLLARRQTLSEIAVLV